MKLDKFQELKIKLEVLKLEKNFFALDRVLYYFSFLGNIFLVYFGYFFIKSIVDTLPQLFPYQSVFLAIFIGLFLTGYELTKRFAIEQLTLYYLQYKKFFTWNSIIGAVAVAFLIAGSFYLSLNGAHRLVDSSEKIEATMDQNISIKADSIAKYYDTEIAYYRAQPARTRSDRKYRDSLVNALQQTKDQKLSQVENKTLDKSQSSLEKNKENDTAFVFMTFFLEFIIVLGVAFNGIYTIGSYEETKKLLSTPKYKQAELNLMLLKLYYQNGKKQPGDQVLSLSKMLSLVKNQKVNCSQADVRNFVVYCSELDIIKEVRARRKEYQVDYTAAKSLIENELVL
jgi:hypothetical protein